MAYFLLRGAGLEGGFEKSDREIAAELSEITKLLMRSGEHFLPDAFRGLQHLQKDRRLLILERIANGVATVEGCIAFSLRPVICVDPLTGETVMRRVNMLRILAVMEGEHRAELARRLALEAQLRGTIRSMYDNEDEPHAVGTFGIIMEPNIRALKWAEWLRPDITILPGGECNDDGPVLVALRDQIEQFRLSHESPHACHFVFANRTTLIEAAMLNEAGRQYVQDDSGLTVDYDMTDLLTLTRKIQVAVSNLAKRNPSTMARFGLLGDRAASIWGPPETSMMRIGGGWNLREYS